MGDFFPDNIINVGYLAIWVVTLYFYHKQSKRVDAGSIIIMSYILYAVFSLISYNDELFSMMYEPVKVFPYVYLYVMLMIALAPSFYYHKGNYLKLEDSNTRIITNIAIITIICGIFIIPDIVNDFGSGMIDLFLDSDAGKDAYSEQLDGAEDTGSAITNIPAIIYNAIYDLAIFVLFLLLTKKEKNKILIILLLFSITLGLIQPIMKGQRTGVILGIQTLILAYFLFRQFLSKRINRFVQVIGFTMVALIMLPIVALTLSRFSDRVGTVSGFINWYVGQGNIYFNNYALEAGGIRYGDRTLNLFKRIVVPDTPKNFVERREKYHNLEIDDYYFTTFVGDFTIDFGPVMAFVIFVFFNALVLCLIKNKGDTIKVHQLLLVYFCGCICMQGGMYLFAYSDTANLKILAAAALYVYMIYHEKLLIKFPKEQ